jgi:hypothetical protein
VELVQEQVQVQARLQLVAHPPGMELHAEPAAAVVADAAVEALSNLLFCIG